MPNILNYYSQNQLNHSTGLLLLVCGAIAVTVCLTLIVRSEAALRIFKVANRHISTRRSFRALSIVRDTNQLQLKYRHWLTGFIVAGTAYSLFMLARLNDARVAVGLGLNFQPEFVTWAVESTRLILISLGIFSLVIGIMLTFFPHAFSVIEKRLSRWYSPRMLIHPLERMHLGFDTLVEAFPRTTGWIILFPALAIFLSGMALY